MPDTIRSHRAGGTQRVDAVRVRSTGSFLASLVGAWLLAMGGSPARASIAYGSINNFDTVNDTGVECHGFEIELEDIHSTDITYTYNWNHYGVPQITEDNSTPAHPKVFVRWASARNPDGTWAAYTAIPAGPIAATNGHMFTNPAVNFGGEHFGVGYRAPASAVRYNWLVEDGAGNLILGPAVSVATPTFVYYPPVAAAPAQVQAAIVPPPPPAPPPKDFGDAVWVKEIRTTTHNSREVPLRNLVSDDPDDPNDANWRNGEPDEVEVEWQLLQTEYNAGNGGANGELKGAPEDLANGDEVVTRRYEFYKYTGPFDAETGEALAQEVAADGIHGRGTALANDTTYDLATIEVVGAYIGSQMSAVDVDAPVGLIDHLQDGEVDTPYTDRTVVVSGAAPFTATSHGDLPAGMSFDPVTGVLSGTPTASGEFAFSVTASDANTPEKTKNYTLTIAAPGADLPPRAHLDTSVSPVGSGNTLGDDAYDVGAQATAVATPSAGFSFQDWTESGTVVSRSPSYTLTMEVNHSLEAHFAPGIVVTTSAEPAAGGSVTGGGPANPGDVTVEATATDGYRFVNWTENDVEVSASPRYTFTATAGRFLVANFAPLSVTRTITAQASPLAGGTTSGDGIIDDGASVTVVATANDGFIFEHWLDGEAIVSTAASYTFLAAADRLLTAVFVPGYAVTTAASPPERGTTSGDGLYEDGAEVTVLATPNAGAIFDAWTESDVVVSRDARYSFLANPARDLVAHFSAGHTVTLTVTPDGAGSARGAGTYATGATVLVTAAPATGFAFVDWVQSGTPVGTAPSYQFQADTDRVIEARFAADPTSVTFDLDSGTPALASAQIVPFVQETAGLTAQFRSPDGPAFSVQTAASTGLALSRFSRQFLKLDGANHVLELGFDQPLRAIALTFATGDAPDLLSGTPVRLTAYPGSAAAPAVGTVTGGGVLKLGDSMPMGRLAFQSAAAFDLVWIELPAVPNGATVFAVDDITVAVTVPATFSLDLQPGWNLCSLPVEPPDPRVDQVLGLPGRAGFPVIGPAWSWDATHGHYEPALELHANQGYWVYAESATAVAIAGAVVRPETHLEPGWNLIGPVWVPTAPGPVPLPLSTDPLGVIEGEIRFYTSTSYAVETGWLQPGLGYWLWANAACQVRYSP